MFTQLHELCITFAMITDNSQRNKSVRLLYQNTFSPYLALKSVIHLGIGASDIQTRSGLQASMGKCG